MAKDAKDDKSDSDQAGGFAKSFDQYEYVAVITPGAALLFGLYLIWQPAIPFADMKDFGLGSLGVFLVAAYVAGHILRAIGDVLERVFWLCCGGMPSEWVLQQNPGLLNDKQQKDLISRVNRRGFDFDSMRLKPGDGWPARWKKFESWQAVTRQISIEVHDAKKAIRVDAFNRTYGMMVGLSTALLIVASLSASSYLGLVAFLLAAVSLYRMYLFGKLYARELFVSFLEATKT